MGRPATFDDLTEVLREQSEAIRKILNVTEANMFIPTDGQGLRMHVSIPKGSSGRLPEQIELRVNDGSEVVVPLENQRGLPTLRAAIADIAMSIGAALV